MYFSGRAATPSYPELLSGPGEGKRLEMGEGVGVDPRLGDGTGVTTDGDGLGLALALDAGLGTGDATTVVDGAGAVGIVLHALRLRIDRHSNPLNFIWFLSKAAMQRLGFSYWTFLHEEFPEFGNLSILRG
jgi:hypothetical protein